MSQKWLLLLFSLTLISQSSYSQSSCGSVDYSKEIGPIRDQGETGWCFAYTAADLLTQKLRKTNPEKFGNLQVSALDVTFQYLQNTSEAMEIPRSDSSYWKQKIRSRQAEKEILKQKDVEKHPILDAFSGGFIDMAVHTYHDNELGVCSEADLPSEKGMTQEIISAVNQKFNLSVLKCAAQSQTKIQDLAKLRNECWRDVIERKCHRIPSGLTKTVKTMDSAVYDSSSLTDGTFVFQSDDEIGGKVDSTQSVRNQLKNILNEGLNHGSIVGIGIAPVFLVKDQIKEKMLREHARHELSVVARKKMDNRCYYQLRNSWGKSCEMYNPKFKSRCSEGTLWVEEGELLPYMTRAHYLE